MTARPTDEWIGKRPQSMPPPRVRQRILERENHTCWICEGPITKPGWHADHVPPLKDGGENRESAIKPAHANCHRLLTAEQTKERAPIERKKMKHTGAIRPEGKIKGRGFDRSPKPKRIEKLPMQPPRALFKPKERRP